MILDMHAHHEPRMLGTREMVRKLDAAGVARVVLIPTMLDPLPRTPEGALRLLRVLLQRDWGRPLAEVAHRATLGSRGTLRLGWRRYAIDAQPDNASVAQAVQAHPDRFWGWIFLNPRGPSEPLEELERWRHVPGMVGVKLHPHWHDYRTSALHPILGRCEQLRLPVLVHLGFGRRGDYVELAARFPKLRLIAAHAGFPHFQRLWAHRARAPNLHVDLSSPYLDEALVRAAVAAMGPERCLYGTDAPYGFHEPDGSYDYAAIRGWVERLPVTEAGRARVLSENFLELVDGVRR